MANHVLESRGDAVVVNVFMMSCSRFCDAVSRVRRDSQLGLYVPLACNARTRDKTPHARREDETIGSMEGPESPVRASA